MSQKIIILQSVQDSITFRREMRIQNSPFLQEYEFEHIYAIVLSPEQQRLPTELMMMQVDQNKLDGEDLLKRITAKLESFKPDILIIHSGFVFHRFPEEMLSVLKSLKTSYPTLRMGIQSHFYKDNEQLGIFEYSSEIDDLISKIF